MVSYWSCYITVESETEKPYTEERMVQEYSHTSMIDFCRSLYADISGSMDEWVSFVDYLEEDLEEKRGRLAEKLERLKELISEQEKIFWPKLLAELKRQLTTGQKYGRVCQCSKPSVRASGGGLFVKEVIVLSARQKGTLCVFLAAVLYSIGGLCIKLIPWSGMAINGARTAIALVVIGFYLKLTHHKPQMNLWVLVGALAVCGTNILFPSPTS